MNFNFDLYSKALLLQEYYPDLFITCQNIISEEKSKSSDTTSKKLSFKHIWELFEEICTRTFPEEITEMIIRLKPELCMQIYSTIQYPLCQAYSKAAIDRSYSAEIDIESENIKRVSTATRNQLKESFSPLYLNRRSDCVEPLSYLSPFWSGSNTEPTRLFDPSDFAFMIRSYKNWLFYPDNQFGMSFGKFFKGVTDIFFHEKSMEEAKKACNYKAFKNEHSAFLFESIFHAQAFFDTVNVYIDHFKNQLGNVSSPDRERIMVLLMPISIVPMSLRNSVCQRYVRAIENFYKIRKKESSELQLRTELYKLISLSVDIIPMAENILSALVCSNFSDNELKEKVVESFIEEIKEEYISTDFQYYKKVSDAILNFNNSSFPPLLTQDGKKMQRSTPKKFCENKDDTPTLKSFEINFSYNFLKCTGFTNGYEYSHTWKCDIYTYVEILAERLLSSAMNTPAPKNTSNFIKFETGIHYGLLPISFTN